MAAIAVIGYGLSPHTPTSWQSVPPAPHARTAGPAYSLSRDVVPFITVNNSIHITATIGGYPSDMMVDTGANVSQVTQSLANRLIAQGEAQVVGSNRFTMANGSSDIEPVIIVRKLTIGRHTCTNVLMSVAPDGAGNLLGLPVLKSIGKLTIDSARGQLIFG
jgi:hypothetical protein